MWLPAVGQQFVELVDGLVGHAGDHVAKIGEGVDVVAFGASDQAEEDRGGAAAGVASGEKPVMTANRDRANVTFTGAVVDRQHAVLDVAIQRGPVRQRVVDRFPNRAFWQRFMLLVFEPGTELVENRYRFVFP